MDELPIEIIIEIFSKISLREKKIFTTISKINKKFYFVYKKYFEHRVKHFVDFGKKVTVNISRSGDLISWMYLNNLSN